MGTNSVSFIFGLVFSSFDITWKDLGKIIFFPLNANVLSTDSDLSITCLSFGVFGCMFTNTHCMYLDDYFAISKEEHRH